MDKIIFSQKLKPAWLEMGANGESSWLLTYQEREN